MIVKCSNCGEDFDKLPNQIKRSKLHFCSKECKNDWDSKNRITRNCSNCNKEITRRKSQMENKEHIFCDKKCYSEWKSKNIRGEKHPLYKNKILHNCNYCNKEIGLHESRYNSLLDGKVNNIFCSKTCKENWEKENFTGQNNPNYKNGNVIKICEYCNEEYDVPYHRKDITKFCSVECKNKWQSEILPKNKDWVEFRRSIAIKVLLNQKNKFTKPELLTKDFLEINKIEYIAQHPFYNKFVVDFFIPSMNIIIECLGDYWHGHPDKYGDGENKKPLTEKQIKTKEKDIIKYNFLKEKGHDIYMVWERDIYSNIEECYKFLIS